MTLSVLPRDIAGDSAETAFLTPRRIGGAVARNRLRRRMREIYRRTLSPSLDEKHYFIWIVRPNAVELTFPELLECMLTLARRAGVVR